MTMLQLINEISKEALTLKRKIDNSKSIYKQRKLPIYKNLSKRKKTNKFKQGVAERAFLYLVNDGAKMFDRSVPKKVRKELAKEYVNEFEKSFKKKDFDFMK